MEFLIKKFLILQLSTLTICRLDIYCEIGIIGKLDTFDENNREVLGLDFKLKLLPIFNCDF